MRIPARTTCRAILAVGCLIAFNTPARASQEAQIGPSSATAAARMPIQQLNELVRKRCAMCHSGENPKGGLNNATAPMALVPIPAQTLTIRDVVVYETVIFPFDRLSPVVRRQLATCVPKPIT